MDRIDLRQALMGDSREAYETFEKVWSDAARAASAAARKKGMSLGQAAAKGVRRKKGEHATTTARRRTEHQGFVQAAAADRAASAPHRQAGIASAKAQSSARKAMGSQGPEPRKMKPGLQHTPRASALDTAMGRKPSIKPKRSVQDEVDRVDQGLHEYGQEAGFSYRSKDLVDMYEDNVRHDLAAGHKHITIGIPGHGEVSMPRSVAEHHLGIKSPPKGTARKVKAPLDVHQEAERRMHAAALASINPGPKPRRKKPRTKRTNVAPEVLAHATQRMRRDARANIG